MATRSAGESEIETAIAEPDCVESGDAAMTEDRCAAQAAMKLGPAIYDSSGQRRLRACGAEARLPRPGYEEVAMPNSPKSTTKTSLRQCNCVALISNQDVRVDGPFYHVERVFCFRPGKGRTSTGSVRTGGWGPSYCD